MRAPQLLSLLGFIVLLGGCSKGNDRERVAAAVENLQSGAVVRAVEAAILESQESPAKGAEAKSEAAAEADPLPEELPVSCRDLPVTSEDATFTQADGALEKLMACYRDLLYPGNVVNGIISYLRYFRPESETQYSAWTQEEMLGFLRARPANFYKWLDIRIGAVPNSNDPIRNSFSDSELTELVKLIQRRTLEYSRAERIVAALSQKHRALLELYAREIDRYQVLLALVDTQSDTVGVDTALLLSGKMKLELTADVAAFPLLHPHGIGAVIPEKGQEFSALYPSENPFSVAHAVLGDIGGGLVWAENIIAEYTRFRAQDNPALPNNPKPAEQAVRVAFIDSGIDFQQFPELGVFLGPSQDYADADQNPWLPAVRDDFSHGSATTTTLLSVLSRYAPSVLTERKLDLRFWKVQSLRQLLGGSFAETFTWESHKGEVEALRNGPGAQGDVPRIVSVSMSVPLKWALDLTKDAEAIRRSPWLWVMAAGNSGMDVNQSAGCFSDLVATAREDSRILCVGALNRATETQGERIADYSNFGERVDVYAYESYAEMCPAGTSCSTPAISAAATALAAEFPLLSNSQLKGAIVNAAEERVLQVGESDEKRKVRVFDPGTMMDRARKAAQSLLTAVPATETR